MFSKAFYAEPLGNSVATIGRIGVSASPTTHRACIGHA
jgi:hypothetical protein